MQTHNMPSAIFSKNSGKIPHLDTLKPRTSAAVRTRPAAKQSESAQLPCSLPFASGVFELFEDRQEDPAADSGA